MLLDDVNLNHLRIFECVFRVRSMSVAARELHLTQSGVSQHIQSLEEKVGRALFDRIQRRLVPTAEGAALFEKCSQGLEILEQGLRRVQGKESVLTGTVSVGMPAEFGNNIVLPKVARFCIANPEVKLRVQLGIAAMIHEQLRAGELDFAFVDAFLTDRSIRSQRVFDEELVLCASQDYFRSRGIPSRGTSRSYFESLEYVDYLEGEPVLRSWFSHHLGVKHPKLNVRTTVMEVQSVARLIQEGLGAGILPRHRVEQLKESGAKLVLFKGSEAPLRNTISLASLAERTHSSAAKAMKEFLIRSMLA